MSWVAFGDESARFLALPQAYVLAAAVIEESMLEEARDTMAALAVRGMPFHWHDGDPRVGFDEPEHEPLIVAADIVAGAIGHSLEGDSKSLDFIAHSAEIHQPNRDQR